MLHFNVKDIKGVCPLEIFETLEARWQQISKKGVFITTGSFTKAARDEASEQGKQQIDLIDGDEFMNKLAEYNIGLKEVKSYDIDENFFRNV